MTRTTRRMLDNRMEELRQTLGRPAHVWHRDDTTGTLRATIGALYLDAAPAYGGYAIEEVTNEGGAVRQWNYCERLPAGAMLTALRIAIEAARIAATPPTDNDEGNRQ